MEDQTPIQPLTPFERGTGILLERAPTGSRKRIVAGVTHDGLVAEGRTTGALAVKWVTTQLASEQQVRESRCEPDAIRCERRCVQPGCVCDRERKICV